jgi:hypothetical protein
VLTEAQKERLVVLQRELGECQRATDALYAALQESTRNMDEPTAEKRREEFITAHREEFQAQAKRSKAIHKELDPLVGGEKSETFVWLYENTAKSSAATAR